MLKLHVWQGYPNFGDLISIDIVQWLTGESPVIVQEGELNKLLAAGSILQNAQSGDTIWGTGLHPRSYENFWRNYEERQIELKVLAVRGPITRDALLARGIHCPKVFGDPGILLPLFFPGVTSKTIEVAFVPHYSDYEWSLTISPDLNLRVINPSDDWKNVVSEITRAKKVVSSSLHGIIVAEAYGIPAVWLRTTYEEGYLKYLDYYLGTGRIAIKAESLEEALALEVPPPPSFSKMQSDLCEAFRSGGLSETRPG